MEWILYLERTHISSNNSIVDKITNIISVLGYLPGKMKIKSPKMCVSIKIVGKM